jgi:hypothetical protein
MELAIMITVMNIPVNINGMPSGVTEPPTISNMVSIVEVFVICGIDESVIIARSAALGVSGTVFGIFQS